MKFEYKVTTIRYNELYEMENQLDALGKEGWELVTVFDPVMSNLTLKMSVRVVFKRTKQP